MNLDDWTPTLGALCVWVPHHPALQPLDYPVRVTRIVGEPGRPSFWCAPIGPIRQRIMRDGRVVEQAPNFELLCGAAQLRPHIATATETSPA